MTTSPLLANPAYPLWMGGGGGEGMDCQATSFLRHVAAITDTPKEPRKLKIYLKVTLKNF